MGVNFKQQQSTPPVLRGSESFKLHDTGVCEQCWGSVNLTDREQSPNHSRTSVFCCFSLIVSVPDVKFVLIWRDFATVGIGKKKEPTNFWYAKQRKSENCHDNTFAIEAWWGGFDLVQISTSVFVHITKKEEKTPPADRFKRLPKCFLRRYNNKTEIQKHS